jgi:pyruvate formate lyase activating enzyme
LEIAFTATSCIYCRRCVEICPESAIDLDFKGRINRQICTRCGKCAAVCPGTGLRTIGTYYPIDSLVELLLRDLPFYRYSRGGVTLSGGECTLYPDYICALSKKLKEYSIHVSIQTSGYFDYESFKEKILPYVDLVFFDLKIADPNIHLSLTGKSNRRIISNLRRLIKVESAEIRPRIPIIPDITSTRENLSDIIQILVDAGADAVTLLPYNPMGFELGEKIGKPLPKLPLSFMSFQEEKRVHSLAESLVKKNLCIL